MTDLRTLALAATGWQPNCCYTSLGPLRDYNHAASPAAILALLDERDAAVFQFGLAESIREALGDEITELKAERDALRRQVDEDNADLGDRAEQVQTLRAALETIAQWDDTGIARAALEGQG